MVTVVVLCIPTYSPKSKIDVWIALLVIVIFLTLVALQFEQVTP